MPGQGMPWLALEQPAPDPAPEGRISEIIQDEDRLVDPSECAARAIKMRAGTAGQQALQGQRRRRVARGEGRKKLAYTIPMGGDPVEVNGALRGTEERREWSVLPLQIEAIDPLAMQPPHARTKALPKPRQGGKVQCDIAMRIGGVFLGIQVRLVIEQPVENKAPCGRTLQPSPLDQGPARCALAAYV